MLLPLFERSKFLLDGANPAEVGMKAYSLCMLAKAGLLIPNTWVIPVKILDSLSHDTNIEPSTQTSSWLPPLLSSNLCSLCSQYKGPWIIRSSAIDEDGTEFSFAGQYESVGEVHNYEQMLVAIQRVWQSYFAEHVDVYRPEKRKGMAILIQQEIDAQYAGVVFTQNPISGKNELVLESVAGKGEKVVSAHIVPGRSFFWCPNRLRRKRLFRFGLVLKKTEKPEWLPPLALQKKICSSGCLMESICEIPLDLEWVIDQQGQLFFVQSRPITNKTKKESNILWTRQFLGERWTIPATELGWNEIDDLMTPLIDYRDTHEAYLGGGKATRLFAYSPYINATIFRHLLFRLPYTKPTPSFFLEMLPVHEQKMWNESGMIFPDVRVYKSIIATTIIEQRWKRFRWNPYTNYQKWDGFVLQLRLFLEQHQQTLETIDEAQIRLDSCRKMAMEYLKVHVCSLIYANLWHQWAVWRLKKDGLDHFIPTFVRAHKRTATQRANSALWKLGNGNVSLETVLAEFGTRSENSWAIFAPRWIDAPEDVLRLASWMKGMPNPEEEEKRLLENMEKEILQLSPKLRAKLRITQQYLFLREEQRFYFERLLYVWKSSWLWIEQREGFPIRHLTKSELAVYWSGGLPQARDIVQQREKAWNIAKESWEKNPSLPHFLIGDKPLVQATNTNALYKGIGISAGYVQGKVCIVRSVQDTSNVCSGDIVVLTTLDPGWTPLLLKAGGVIMELGGMLSHGAVITREYGVPAVAALERACSIFQQGEIIALDGTEGAVWRS